MAIHIVIFNSKGGVGKTTSTINIAGELTKNYGKKVLMVDCDENISLSKAFRWEMPSKMFTEMIADYLLREEEHDISEAVCKTMFPNLDIIPSTRGLTKGADKLLKGSDIEELAFKIYISEIEDEYDFILYDAPPSEAHALTKNAMNIADYLIVPFNKGAMALECAVNTTKACMINQKKGFRKLKFLGACMTRNENTSNSQLTVESGIEVYGEKYLGTIPSREDIEHALTAATPLCYYNPRSDASKEYNKLAENILKEIELEENR